MITGNRVLQELRCLELVHQVSAVLRSAPEVRGRRTVFNFVSDPSARLAAVFVELAEKPLDGLRLRVVRLCDTVLDVKLLQMLKSSSSDSIGKGMKNSG